MICSMLSSITPPLLSCKISHFIAFVHFKCQVCPLDSPKKEVSQKKLRRLLRQNMLLIPYNNKGEIGPEI